MDIFFKYLNIFPMLLWLAMMFAPKHPLRVFLHIPMRGMTRKSVTGDVDILLQQGHLALDSRQKVILGMMEEQKKPI